MAITSELPIYKVAYDLLDAITDLARNMPDDELYQSANSYFGLLRQATHSHCDRARLANVLRYRGHCINKGFTKTFRNSTNHQGGNYGNQ